jgi:hypothetical protein
MENEKMNSGAEENENIVTMKKGGVVQIPEHILKKFDIRSGEVITFFLNDKNQIEIRKNEQQEKDVGSIEYVEIKDAACIEIPDNMWKNLTNDCDNYPSGHLQIQCLDEDTYRIKKNDTQNIPMDTVYYSSGCH